MSRFLSLPFGLFLATLPACGGTDRGRPSDKTSGSASALPCDAANGYDIRTFVDFEGEPRTFPEYPDPRIQATCAPGICQPSAFYFNFDLRHSNPDPNDLLPCTMGTMADPEHKVLGCECLQAVNPDTPAKTDPVVASNLYGRAIDRGGRCGVPGNANHVVTTNIATCYGLNGRLGWGASMDVKLLSGSTPDDSAGGAGGAPTDGAAPPGSEGFDASDYDGVSFWVRKGTGASNSAFIVSMTDPGTTAPAPGQPGCSELENAADSDKCDAFGVAITVTDEWTFVPALFRSMRQKGFGRPSPLGRLDSGNLAKIQFLFSAGDWDVWIDDIAFFREPKTP